MNNLFSDPLKLLPLVSYVGIFIALSVGKISAQDAVLLLGATGAGHALISSVNNVNPPKAQP